jgi:capsular polysaccharide biosynthesis protein
MHGGRTPFFGAPEKAYLADAQSLDTWEEMVLIKVRAGNPQDAVNMAEELLAEVLQTHNGHVESNREAVTRILELAKQESDQLEKTPDSPEKVLAQVLLEERIARLRQQLDEFIKNSEIVQAPGDVVLRLKPRPFLYTVVGLLVSLVSSVMLVVMTVWLRTLVRELREVSGKS